MLDNQGFQNAPDEQPIMEGTPVYDVNGDKIGEVKEGGLQRNALMVQKGIFFPKDLYIPLSAIRGRDANGIHLSVAKDQVNSHNWDTPPTDRGTLQWAPETTGDTPSSYPDADSYDMRARTSNALDEDSEDSTLP